MRSRRPILRTVAATALAASLAGAVTAWPTDTADAGPAAAPVAGSVPPDQDPFYAAPPQIGSYRPGQVVDGRAIVAKASGLDKTVDAWQISYRTNDSHDQPELAVTTLLVPKTPWPGPGPRPVVSLQVPEDSTGTQCTPSYGISSGDPIAATNVFFAPSILNRNWAVVLPDYEGPRSAWMAGPQAGHAVLDGVRAVRAFGQGGIGTANFWGLTGYSGGGHATAWAAQLQPSYAPDLTLAGAAMGGTPSGPAALARYMDGGPLAGFTAEALASLDTEYPEAGIAGLVGTQGQADLARARGKCLPRLLLDFAFHQFGTSTLFAQPSVAATLTSDTLGGAAPTIPIFDYHAKPDELVPVSQDDAITSAWCHAGATVQILRDQLGEHYLEALRRDNDALTFLADRFAMKPASTSC